MIKKTYLRVKRKQVRIFLLLLASPLIAVVVISIRLMAGTMYLDYFNDSFSSFDSPQPVTLDSSMNEPGLLVRFTQPGTSQTDVRVSRLTALNVSADEHATPFLEPGPFETQWEGWLEISESDDYAFHFDGLGKIELSVGGTLVLQADSRAEGSPVYLNEGVYDIRLHYQSPKEMPARMRLLWSGSTFQPEPLPPTALSHDSSDDDLIKSKKLRRGRELIANFSCLKCHKSEEPNLIVDQGMPELERDAPDLNGTGARLRTGWLKNWLEDPHSIRARAKMPRINLDRQEAADIAIYLSSLGKTPSKDEDEKVLGGVARTSEGGHLYSSLGCVACHTLKETTGNIKTVVERISLIGVADKWYPSALADYISTPSRHYKWTGMPDFNLEESEADALASFLFSVSDFDDTTSEVTGEIHRGERLIMERGCASCHKVPVEDLQKAPSLESLADADWQQGWMDSKSNNIEHPLYPTLTEEQMEALQTLATKGFNSLQKVTPIEFASRQILELNCRACHELDGLGENWEELKDEVAHLNSDADNRVIQRLPTLTWAGEKLQPEWLERLLAGKTEYETRPWMEARMPTIGAKPGLLAKGLVETHGFDVDFEHIQTDPELISFGRRLSTDIGGGFGCNFCHGGDVNVDMYLMGERLRPEFFSWKMRTPSRLTSQSGMPQFGNPRDGRTRLRETLEGDADQQFEAIWHFLIENRISRQDPNNQTSTRLIDLNQKMDTGPFLSRVIDVPNDRTRTKGISIRVGEKQQATLNFDHDLLNMNLGWTGEFLTYHSTNDFGVRNSDPPTPGGDVQFTLPEVAGWSIGSDPKFSDPRKEPFGPMPDELGTYNGLYLHGDRVVLNYSVGGNQILESPWYVENGKVGAFVRDLQVNGNQKPISTLLFASEGEVNIERRGSLQIASASHNGQIIMAAVLTTNSVQLVKTFENQIALQFDPQTEKRTVRVLYQKGTDAWKYEFVKLASDASDPDPIEQLTEPGPARWGDPLITQGEFGKPQGAYVADILTIPEGNPYNALLHFTGIDFMDDGRAVLTTIHGDVWLVNGFDESLEKLEWKRFATGLNMPFGVRVVDGNIYVSNEDELTILHDRNGNDEADYYEKFRNIIAPGADRWQQAFGLETDDEGNFYFVRGNGNRLSDFSNGVIKVSPDGTEMELIATGFRQPFGMGISPEGHITVSQQEGTWVPQTPVSKIDLDNRKGSFYGFEPNRYRRENPYPRELGYEPPILWMPRNIDNSGGGQVWVESDNWGMPRGQMLHFAYGRESLLQIMHEEVNGDLQGAVVPLLNFNKLRPRSGRFNSQDGHLYVTGLRGGLERVRYTGANLYQPMAIHVHENGLRIRFSDSLSPEMVNIANFKVHRWNYRWIQQYGSEFYSVKNPELMGEDPVEVTSARLLDDGKEIFLEIPNMKPADQMRISYDLKATDGTNMKKEIYNTVHHLGSPFEL